MGVKNTRLRLRCEIAKMARAKRYFISGYVWHISHRCHKKDFLLKFAKDRYHATAIQTGRHLIQCLVYIDLNMVRAGVVSHSSQWSICGYNEIQNPKKGMDYRFSLPDESFEYQLF